jgi:hypothetical protein
MIEDHPLFAVPVEVPEELAAAAAQRGWPDGLLKRALDLRVQCSDIQLWLSQEGLAVEEIGRQLDTFERLLVGPVRAREATWRDGEALVDLYANAPEDFGEVELIVERAPNPFAQFRLQEHGNMQVLDCRGVLLAAAAHSTRNALVNGQRLAVHMMSAWRVRKGFRGYGLSRLLQFSAGPASSWFGTVTYWYERSGNASQGWLDKIRSEVDSRGNDKVAGLSTTVDIFSTVRAEPSPSLRRFRPAEEKDLSCCVELINRTHRGLDLFRPYTVEFLEGRLDDPCWGPKPGFWMPVYGWDDYWVVETNGTIVACGGLWDRGRDIRERWRVKEGHDEQIVEATALLDWGYAPGHEDAMAALIREFLRRSAELGRSHLLAPLEFAASVRELLRGLEPKSETRALRCMGFEDGTVHVRPEVTRPYTDLAYW